jgi:hypothetical protein
VTQVDILYLKHALEPDHGTSLLLNQNQSLQPTNPQHLIPSTPKTRKASISRQLGIFLCFHIFLMATVQQNVKPEHKMAATTKIQV